MNVLSSTSMAEPRVRTTGQRCNLSHLAEEHGHGVRLRPIHAEMRSTFTEPRRDSPSSAGRIRHGGDVGRLGIAGGPDRAQSTFVGQTDCLDAGCGGIGGADMGDTSLVAGRPLDCDAVLQARLSVGMQDRRGSRKREPSFLRARRADGRALLTGRGDDASVERTTRRFIPSPTARPRLRQPVGT